MLLITYHEFKYPSHKNYICTYEEVTDDEGEVNGNYFYDYTPRELLTYHLILIKSNVRGMCQECN